jgi:hypothetical protein
MALILTPSLSQTHFCKSDNCGISKVTRDSDLICQILVHTSTVRSNEKNQSRRKWWFESIKASE